MYTTPYTTSNTTPFILLTLSSTIHMLPCILSHILFIYNIANIFLYMLAILFHTFPLYYFLYPFAYCIHIFMYICICNCKYVCIYTCILYVYLYFPSYAYIHIYLHMGEPCFSCSPTKKSGLEKNANIKCNQ
jgi:hypothetical protein